MIATVQRLRPRSRERAIYRHLCQRLSRHRGTRVMASVNYRRHAGNLIDRDKRSNCRGGGTRPGLRCTFFSRREI